MYLCVVGFKHLPSLSAITIIVLVDGTVGKPGVDVATAINASSPSAILSGFRMKFNETFWAEGKNVTVISDAFWLISE